MSLYSTIRRWMRLEFFRGEEAKKTWRYVIGILIYVLISIFLSHLGENKAKYMSKLQAENRRLRSQYVSVQSLLMTRQLRSNVYDRLKEDGFVIPKRPPVQIVSQK